MRKMPRSKVFGVFEKCSLHKIKQIWGFARGRCLANGWGKGLEKGEVLSFFGEKFTLKGEIWREFAAFLGKIQSKFAKFSEFCGEFKQKFSSWREFRGKFGELSKFWSEFQAKFSGETPKKVLCHYRTWKQYER